jgi:entry exclusion lipoprotein TrbK
MVTTMRVALMALVLVAAMALEACGKTAAPEATDENCLPDNIQSIKDPSARQELANKCFRRGGFRPSTPKNW